MRILMVVREDTVFLQHRLPIAVAARRTGYDVHVFSVDTGKLDCIRGMGFSTHELPQKVYWIPFWGALKNVVHYIAAFRRLKPDIIHLSSTYVCLLGGFAALFVRRSRVVLSFTGLGYIFSAKRRIWRFVLILLRPIIAYIWNRPNIFPLFQNMDDAEELKALGLSKRNPEFIVGAGVDVDLFKPGKKRRINDEFVIGCAARLLQDKGIHHVVAAMEKVRHKSSRVVVKFAGSIDPFNPSSLSDAEIARWKDLPNVRFIGHQADMVEFWRSCDAAILASLREGTPKALLEAASTGLPLLASDVIGCREVVSHGKNGYLFRPSDPEDIAMAILKLANDGEFCRKAGQASRDLIFDKGLDAETVGKKYADFLGRISVWGSEDSRSI